MSAENNRFYLHFESVMGGRGEIFQTPRSEIYQFRSWVSEVSGREHTNPVKCVIVVFTTSSVRSFMTFTSGLELFG